METRPYLERVYAGVLGKLIGVYLGRPFEGWSYAQITEQLGDIRYYVHDRLNKPLIVTDDDISGTLLFLRALSDYDPTPNLTPAQVGQTWLNYIIENQTVLWWGGLGNSTEHTAYLRLKRGLPAPASGSALTNGRVVAEQIGAQIFIDGWAMVAPGDAERAADLARRAASVSHDGEAIYGAQVIAAMEALAFVEPDLNTLLDAAVSFIPPDSIIYRLISDLRDWRAGEPDWRRAREKLEAHYGYDKYGGNCHIVPNHGVVQLALLYGDNDFQQSLLVANTAGWDTDCNSGNVGCLLGIKNGLAALNAGPDWRGPVADRLYLPSADGGGAITDAAREAYTIANLGLALKGQPLLQPKDGARFHFEAPGAVQGFEAEATAGALLIENTAGHSLTGGRSLALRFRDLELGVTLRAGTATFMPPSELHNTVGYGLKACPTLYPGQEVRARLSADLANPSPVTVQLYLQVYDGDDHLQTVAGPQAELPPGQAASLTWRVPDLGACPIARIGVELHGTGQGSVYLDYLTWDGAPTLNLTRPAGPGVAWRRAWTDAVDKFSTYAEPLRIIQNEGTGLLIQGTREWTDYTVSADITPHLAEAAGLAARVQGLRRYYALTLSRPGQLRLVKVLDGERVLAQADYAWEFGSPHELTLTVRGAQITARINDRAVFEIVDTDRPLLSGAIALLVTEGRTATQRVAVRP